MPFFDPKIENDRIRHKRSFTQGEVPADGTLRPGELAVNVADGIAFIGDANGITRRVGPPNQIVSTSGISALTEGQQAAVSVGTVVTTTDGKRWVYKGAGSKVAESSYIELADITPVWSAISGKPTAFPPEQHNHGISDVSDLGTVLSGIQLALDGKADSSHSHSISDVSQLATELAGKAAASHGHPISDVSYLQESLNAKADSGHTHVPEDVAGLAATLDSKVSSAPDWTPYHALATGGRYLAGDLVYYQGGIYRAYNDNESLPPSNPEYWAYVGPGYRLNIDGRDIPNLPTELPAGVEEGQVLTWTTGQWLPGAGGGTQLPTASNAVPYFDGSNWQVSTDNSPTDIILRYGAAGGQAAVRKSSSANGDACFFVMDNMGTTTELYSGGIRFSDGSTLTSASGAGGLPSAGQGSNLAYYNGAWIGSDSVSGSHNHPIYLSYGYGNGSSWVQATSMDSNGSYYAALRVTNDNGMSFTELNAGGIRFPDGTVQGTASSLPNSVTNGFPIAYYNGNWVGADSVTGSSNAPLYLSFGYTNPASYAYANPQSYDGSNNASFRVTDNWNSSYTEMNAQGFRFPDGSVQSTAVVLPPPSGYGYLPMSDGSTWITTGDAGSSVAWSLLKYGYSNTSSYAYATNTDWAGSYSAALRVTNDNNSSYTEMNAQGLRFPDGSIQNSAGLAVPSPWGGAVPIFDGSGWKASTTNDNSLDLILRYAWGNTQAYVWATSGGGGPNGSSPTLRVTENGNMNSMEVFSNGLRFPDGTYQTTAAGGGSKVLLITGQTAYSMMSGAYHWPYSMASGIGYMWDGMSTGYLPVTPTKFYKVTVFMAVQGDSGGSVLFGLTSNGGSSGTFTAYGGFTVGDDGGYTAWDSISDTEAAVVTNVAAGGTYTFGAQTFILQAGGGDTQLQPLFRHNNSNATLLPGSWIMLEQLD